MPVYDKTTKRFDQPYVTGNCAGKRRIAGEPEKWSSVFLIVPLFLVCSGEGICGTCLVQVLSGKELLNKPDGVEQMVIDKWKGATWRLSCRTIVGATNQAGVVRFKVTPQKGFTDKKK